MKKTDELSLLQNIQYYSLVGLSKFFAFLGFSFSKHLGNFLGFLMWHLLKRRRRLATVNIKKRLGKTQKEAEKIAYKSFKHSARSFIEITLVKSFSFQPLRTEIRIAEPELLKDLQECERPIVAATAHQGAWELMAALVGDLYESPRPRMIVVRKYPNPVVHKFISRCRESHGAAMVGHKMAAMHVIRALKNKGIVAFLVDHRALAHEAVNINFLDKKTAVNMGPAILALRGNALVLPIFLVRDKQGYVLHIQPPLDTTTLEGTREEKVEKISEFYTQAVEKVIRQYPEQWFWMHNRWKDF